MGALWLAFKASRYARWLAMAGAALIAFFAILRKAKRQGRDEVKNEINEDHIERMESGNEAVQREREETRDASNSDLVDRLRRRDSGWGGM